MTTARGTMGYIAPEVFSRNFGNEEERTSVQQRTENITEVYYPEWIYNLLEEGEDLRIHVEEEEDTVIARRLAIVGLWCIQWHPIDRPSMKGVVHMLEGEENITMAPNPFASTGPTGTSASMPARNRNLQLEVIVELE
ncbi:putative glycerophosphodiester phosphodiesterase [Rosa chinensis]|uniref:Putative glycerophosphodiester phosphodiesterase n=1 Tax=Rosa chinensis TaxID=74649 RepID=A0A2P6SC40_ROSCH|nr:putative glycerophosphodiester phosphodiesterase [Rosa chinensis]